MLYKVTLNTFDVYVGDEATAGKFHWEGKPSTDPTKLVGNLYLGNSMNVNELFFALGINTDKIEYEVPHVWAGHYSQLTGLAPEVVWDYRTNKEGEPLIINTLLMELGNAAIVKIIAGDCVKYIHNHLSDKWGEVN